MQAFIAKIPTPLLNTPDFQKIFHLTPPLDAQGLLRAVEMVALPGTKFFLSPIAGKYPPQILPVWTEEYPVPIFVHRAFLQEASIDTPQRKRSLPSKAKILSFLEEAVGVPYIWGGNWKEGIPELAQLYPRPSLSPQLETILSLKGLDCSGLLYQATEGYTPRNSSELFQFGQEIGSVKDPIDLLIKELAPLDLIVWKGHVIIVLNQELTIESLLTEGGVVKKKIRERLASIQDKDFSVRRFT